MEISLITCLRAVWLAAILPVLAASIPSRYLKGLHDLLTLFSSRGKTVQSKSNKFTIAQSKFIHFYVFSVVWTTLLLVATWHYAYTTESLVPETFRLSSIARQLTGDSSSYSLHLSHTAKKEERYRIWLSVFMLLLMEVQVLRRLFETLYVFKYSPSARMHIFGYLTGICFYAGVPLSLCCTCVSDVSKHALNFAEEFMVKGKDRMQIFESDWRGAVNPLLTLKWCAWLGAAIFFYGWIHQRRCHAILGSLRKNQKQAEDYIIPHGDWFELVSCPHYLAEIVIYGSFVIASGCSDLTLLLLWGFVVANLVFAAAETHRWYGRKFDNYPSKRFAIIPLVY